MKPSVQKTPIQDLLIVEAHVFEDERGFFMETWNKKSFADAGIDANFVQENHSLSQKGVLRGLHYQDMSAPLVKLVRCIRGTIFDVAVDLREKSPTFGNWFGIELTADNKKQLYIPVGFAHGFVTLSDLAEVEYKQTGHWVQQAEGVIIWNDPDIGIEWPTTDVSLAKKDTEGMSLQSYRKDPAFT